MDAGHGCGSTASTDIAHQRPCGLGLSPTPEPALRRRKALLCPNYAEWW